MFKVMVADDEIPIISWFRTSVDWESHGLQLVAAVDDGPSALEFLNSSRPDIAIVDIRMPGMDGLSLIETVHRKHLHTRFVILSGYSSFEYAQRAVGLPVVRYLLKPLDEDDLMDVLDSIVFDLRKNLLRKRDATTALADVQELLPLAKREAVRAWLTGRTANAGAWPDALKFEQLRNVPVMVVLLYTVGRADAEFPAHLQDSATSAFLRDEIIVDCDVDASYVLVIHPCPRRDLVSRLQGLRRVVHNGTRMSLRFAVSDLGTFEDAPRLLTSVRQQLREPGDPELPGRAAAPRASIVSPGVSSEDVRNIATQVARTLQAGTHPASDGRRDNVLVSQVLVAIPINIGNSRLSLKWIAKNVVFASADYLSKAFARETGCRFTSYVTNLRMETAKILLRRGDVDTIGEIARLVGYGANAQYFSHVFHRHSKVSPTDFRNTVAS